MKHCMYLCVLRWFSCVFLNSEEVELRFEEGKVHGENVMYGTRPSVFHGNGPSKVLSLC